MAKCNLIYSNPNQLSHFKLSRFSKKPKHGWHVRQRTFFKSHTKSKVLTAGVIRKCTGRWTTQYWCTEIYCKNEIRIVPHLKQWDSVRTAEIIGLPVSSFYDGNTKGVIMLTWDKNTAVHNQSHVQPNHSTKRQQATYAYMAQRQHITVPYCISCSATRKTAPPPPPPPPRETQKEEANTHLLAIPWISLRLRDISWSVSMTLKLRKQNINVWKHNWIHACSMPSLTDNVTRKHLVLNSFAPHFMHVSKQSAR